MSAAVRGVALRSICGFAGSALSGFVIFDLAGIDRSHTAGFPVAILDPTRLASHTLSVGLIAAFIISLVRARRAPVCLAVAVAWSALMLGQAIGAGGGIMLIARPLWAMALAAGIFLAALVFDSLAGAGFRTGKFLLIAPLIAGAYVAASPAALAGTTSVSTVVRDVLMFALVGLVIGNGTGFGVEAAEFFLSPAKRPSGSDDNPGN